MPRLNKASPLARDVFCGIYSTYIVTKSGDVFACGLNNYHQLGESGDGRFLGRVVA